MDTGGNGGCQSSTMVIRSIALGEIGIKNSFTVLWLEFRISAIIAFILAVVNFFRIIIFTNAGLIIATIVSVSLIITIVLAKTIGGLLPIFAIKLKLDPAIMAGPLITTLVDAMSLTIFFALSVKFLGL
jgi:magnesium transporter